MLIEHLLKNDCDTLRLLLSEFEKLYERYTNKNEERIKSIVAYDASQYHPPQYIPNLKGFLTNSLLIETQGLLDFSLPKLIATQRKIKGLAVTPFDKTWKGGNVLFWVKHVMKKELKTGFDFSCNPYSRLRDFFEIRNDHVHYGGYLSDENRRNIVNKLKGVHASLYTDLYDIDFSYCRLVINDAEMFFTEIGKGIH